MIFNDVECFIHVATEFPKNSNKPDVLMNSFSKSNSWVTWPANFFPASKSLDFFSSIPKIYNKLKAIDSVGLGYITLGQSSTTLSGGESQRIKLASELSKKDTGKTIYILDEPTTGLHFEDIRILLNVLNQLVDKGNTIIIIEHNLDVIKQVDYIIDIGPEGGKNGGNLIDSASPKEIIKNNKGYTAKYLSKEFQ